VTAGGETLDAVADLGECDRRRVQLVAAACADPILNGRSGGGLHELGRDASVDPGRAPNGGQALSRWKVRMPKVTAAIASAAAATTPSKTVVPVKSPTNAARVASTT
jgi:hypothetical protein